VHAFPDLSDGIADRAFCGAAHEYVRDPTDEDLMCDVCVVEMQVFLGIERQEAERALSECSE